MNTYCYTLVITLLLLIGSCKTPTQYIQVFKTSGINLKEDANFYTFENDTIKIDYMFWADKGVMAFRVANKSGKAMYIDWKKSTYISNGIKHNYYEDRIDVKSNWSNTTLGYFNSFSSITGFMSCGFMDQSINSIGTSEVHSSGVAKTSVTKQERITFIPPRTHFDKYSYEIANSYYKGWKSGGYTQVKEPRSDKPKCVAVVSSKTFTQASTPLDFRNFLTFSFKEDFSTEFSIDNEFFVKEVLAMDKRHFFICKKVDFELICDSIFPKYQKGKDFYIKTY